MSKFTQKGDILLARYGGSLGKVFWAEEGAYNVAMAKVVNLFEEGPIYKKYLFTLDRCIKHLLKEIQDQRRHYGQNSALWKTFSYLRMRRNIRFLIGI